MSTKTRQDLPVVGLPWGHGVDYREVRTDERCTRAGTPLVLLTESPDSDVARQVCGGHWDWHLLAQHLRVPVVADLPDGMSVDRVDDCRLIVSGPGGQMIVERVSRRT